ncbi:hypothetical protein ABE10_02955 [Bacillus toyonensis]|nr:hypothetical protein [Bacillus toyonensis]
MEKRRCSRGQRNRGADRVHDRRGDRRGQCLQERTGPEAGGDIGAGADAVGDAGEEVAILLRNIDRTMEIRRETLVLKGRRSQEPLAARPEGVVLRDDRKGIVKDDHLPWLECYPGLRIEDRCAAVDTEDDPAGSAITSRGL